MQNHPENHVKLFSGGKVGLSSNSCIKISFTDHFQTMRYLLRKHKNLFAYEGWCGYVYSWHKPLTNTICSSLLYDIILSLLLVCFPLFLFGQPDYKIEGRYKKQTAQGMAIWKDKAFLLNKTGWCREYDLKRRSIVRAFKLACYNDKNHANNASFGVEMIDGSNMPVIYVSECVKPYRCFIEDISGEKPRSVQVIFTVCNGDNGMATDWIIDKKNKKIYTISKILVSKGENKSWRNHIVRFRLPLLSEGSIVKLTEKDIEDSFDVLFPSILQGATIKGRYMYVSVGLQKGYEERFDAQRSIIVIDLKTHIIKKSIDLMRLTDNEPEGVDFYGRQLLLFCGQSGGIFKIRE